MPKDLVAIGSALDEMSWCWISDSYPALAEALKSEADRGASPDQVRRYVMQKTQRLELALRYEQAARWLTHAAE